MRFAALRRAATTEGETMVRNFKTLGLLLAAGMAICAMAAPAAQAEGEFLSEKYPTTTTSFGVEEWFFNGALFKCPEVHKQHELTESSSSAKTTAVYKGCVGFGFINGTVSMNTCSFVFNVEIELFENFFGTMDTSCPAGKKIVFAAGPCEMQVDTQVGLREVRFENQPGALPKKNIQLELALEKVRYNVTKTGFGCPVAKLEEREDGKVKSKVTLNGKEAEGKAVGIWVE